MRVHFEMPCNELKKSNFKIENTIMKIVKSEINLKTSQFYA